MIHTGDCHCGKIQFEVESDSDISLIRCNCSICDRFGYLHLTIPQRLVTLKSGWEDVCLYTFNSGIAQHYFCKICGVKPFYVPRSNPDCYSINFRNVDKSTFGKVTIEDFDGLNWEANDGNLAHLSE